MTKVLTAIQVVNKTQAKAWAATLGSYASTGTSLYFRCQLCGEDVKIMKGFSEKPQAALRRVMADHILGCAQEQREKNSERQEILLDDWRYCYGPVPPHDPESSITDQEWLRYRRGLMACLKIDIEKDGITFLPSVKGWE
jgi:hypothetical protein